jgi:nucleoside-diphosphate-sugar epimerase
MNWQGRPVVVTGGGGFIGSHLVERLVSQGAEVTAMVHGDPLYRPGHLQGVAAPNLRLVGGDLRDGDTMRRTLAGADTVFHLGAVTSVSYSYQHPEETVQTNAMGTQHVCAAAREAGVRRLVHTSTAGVYGDAQNDQPIAEHHRVMGCNPYTAGKLAGDFIAQSYYLSYDLPVCTVRLFNVFGPRMGRYLIMPTIIEQLLRNDRLQLGDLTPTRTFTYVGDIVEAYLAMAGAEGVVGEVVHFGAQEIVTMGELVERIALRMGKKAEITQDPTRLRPVKSEIYKIRVDNRKADELLGWRPRTTLDDGLDATIAWLRARQASGVVSQI